MMQLARNPVLSLAFLASLLSITAFVPTSSAFVVVHPTRTLLSPSSSHKHQPNTALLQPNQKVLAPKENQPVSKSIIIRSKSSRRYLALSEPASTMLASVFQFNGVPLWQAFGVNAVGFLALQKVLSKMLTGEGQVHALFLGTS